MLKSEVSENINSLSRGPPFQKPFSNKIANIIKSKLAKLCVCCKSRYFNKTGNIKILPPFLSTGVSFSVYDRPLTGVNMAIDNRRVRNVSTTGWRRCDSHPHAPRRRHGARPEAEMCTRRRACAPEVRECGGIRAPPSLRRLKYAWP